MHNYNIYCDNVTKLVYEGEIGPYNEISEEIFREKIDKNISLVLTVTCEDEEAVDSNEVEYNGILPGSGITLYMIIKERSVDGKKYSEISKTWAYRGGGDLNLSENFVPKEVMDAWNKEVKKAKR